MEDDDTLPTIHRSEKSDSAVDQLEAVLRELDGPMSVSNCLVPQWAYDVGDVDLPSNPRADDLGYADSSLDTDVSGETLVVEGGEILVNVDDVIDVDEWA